MTYLYPPNISRLSFLKLLQISNNFSNMFIEKNLHIREPTLLKPMVLKGQL